MRNKRKSKRLLGVTKATVMIGVYMYIVYNNYIYFKIPYKHRRAFFKGVYTEIVMVRTPKLYNNYSTARRGHKIK